MELLILAIFLVIAFVFLQAEQKPVNPSSPAASTDAVASPRFKPDNAAEYRAKIAIATSTTDEQHPLRFYKPRPGLEGRNAMDEIYFKGVPATTQSVDLARTLLHGGTLSSDEKIPLLRILARLYDRNNTTGANTDIASELKNFAFDPDKQVAAQAAIHYVGYQPGTDLVLKKALENGALDTNAYFQELAHLIPSSPLEKQKEFSQKSAPPAA
ncbi:hypothetical protein [Variovorax soli]|uniref:Uncharacterized protein n=1 Tax=Variovorax soli TaxID=376815 RepID=A0ABU1N9E8_9BURK|nr:hypothetical protein [Variovorax soli]MDR6534686.1 hypothetical protein [Variovorax soli]